MKELQILDAIGGVADDLVIEAKEASTVKKQLRPVRTALTAAAAAALLAMTVLAAYAARHWDDVLVNVFHIGEPEQAIMDDAVTDVFAREERDGCVYTIKQIMGDAHCIVVSLDIQMPAEFSPVTISTEDLRALTEENGYDWDGVVNRLHYLYGFEETDEYLICSPYFAQEALLLPVDMDEAAFLEGINQMIQEHRAFEHETPPEKLSSETWDLMSWAAYHQALEDFDGDPWTGEGTSFASGMFYQNYDLKTNTLEVLIEMDTENSVKSRVCTLALTELVVEDTVGYYSQPNKSGQNENNVTETLLSEPLILNFTADYEPIRCAYDVLEDGEKIGTLELSPFSAYLTIPLELDNNNTVYSTPQEAVKAVKQRDRLGHTTHSLDVTLIDGTVVTMKMKNSGISYAQTAFFMADRIIDLDQVESITLKNFTIIPSGTAE